MCKSLFKVRTFAHAAGALALDARMAGMLQRPRMRTGGPDDPDEDDELRVLMPLLAMVITIAVVFGG